MTPAQIVRLVSELACRDQRAIASSRGEFTVSETSSLESALLDATRLLTSEGVPHALIGGFAVSVLASWPRATRDVDFAVHSATARERLIAAFVAAGFRHDGSFEHSVNFTHPNGAPVQLASDAIFDQPIERAESIAIGGRHVPVVRRDDLIALKERSAADPRRRKSSAMQDRTDIERLRGDVPGPDEGW
ncbi:MAG TPA: nucleotidyl transferase AbiEii/AbiGii toxin family protein [Planctomycetota bacterium]|nr:nucleotidyl transferase AbiEii/AbiGii toxin family protein [Planctomycetota bacterium]